jgi:hypothetical protein
MQPWSQPLLWPYPSGAVAGTTWNPFDMLFSAVTLSNFNLTATGAGSASSNVGVRGTTGRTTGKYYVEFTVAPGGANFSSSFNTAVGALTLAGDMANWVGGGALLGTGCFAQAGHIYVNGTSGTNQISGGIWLSGDIICMALDLVNQNVWYRRNNGTWNNSGTANPATNTGGITLGTVFTSAAAYPMCGFYQPGDKNTANFGQSAFSFAVPSGFSAWG